MTATAKAQTYRTRPTKRAKPKKARRSKGEIQVIRDALEEILREENPMTVRQVFYRMVSAGVIEKSEAAYKSTICRLLGLMRRERVIPFGWLADSTRWMRKPQTESGLEAALARTAEAYRRALWDNQPVYVEIWLEKDALAGVLLEETYKWDVPLMVTRGYPSLSYLYEAADALSSKGKPAYLYYFGDYDPSGVDITRAVEAGVREFAPDAEIYFERVAVTSEQIELWNLPTRPTKQSDSRSKNFEGESVEVDAIPPAMLRELVSDCITQHVDQAAYYRLLEIEESEKETMLRISEAWSKGKLGIIPDDEEGEQ